MKRIWKGLQSNALVVLDENRNWHCVSLPDAVFPAGAEVNYNAIAGGRCGDIYVGTTAGILFFDRGDGLPGKPGNTKITSCLKKTMAYLPT